MIGHFVALSVRREMEGKRGDEEVESVRKADTDDRARKGQEFLKRDSLSIGSVSVQTFVFFIDGNDTFIPDLFVSGFADKGPKISPGRRILKLEIGGL
jgi:hypothetical protein